MVEEKTLRNIGYGSMGLYGRKQVASSTDKKNLKKERDFIIV